VRRGARASAGAGAAAAVTERRVVGVGVVPGGGVERRTCRPEDLPVPSGDVFNCSQIAAQSAVGLSVDISPTTTAAAE